MQEKKESPIPMLILMIMIGIGAMALIGSFLFSE
jgi:hypothetical protein